MPNEAHSDPKDVELESLIYRRVSQMGLNIHVRVKAGQVSLSGTADDYETRRNIEMAVKEVGGVQKVINQIIVASIL